MWSNRCDSWWEQKLKQWFKEMQEKLLNLKEIQLPEPVSYMPQTFAWYILLLFALSLVGLWILYSHRRSIQNRYRTEALRQLDEIEQSMRPLSELPALVKRVGLAIAKRGTVASLSGDAWLAFLDSTWKGKEFTAGPGRMLPELSYRKTLSQPSASDKRMRDMFILLRRWIRRHRALI